MDAIKNLSEKSNSTKPFNVSKVVLFSYRELSIVIVFQEINMTHFYD